MTDTTNKDIMDTQIEFSTPPSYSSTQSPSLDKLATALSKAQGQMKPAVKDSTNPFFKAKYADLSSVWDACRKPLSDNGLSVVQTMKTTVYGDVCVITTLLHTSGQWIRGELSMKPVKADPQGLGSCLTYNRRYSLAALVGICPEDDDANEASKGEAKKPEKPKKTYKNFPFLQAMEKIKTEIGSDDYTATLKKHGYDHSNQISPANQEGALKVFNTKLQKLVEKREAKE